MDAFEPRGLLRTAHAQTVISSLPLSRWRLRRATQSFEERSKDIVVGTRDGVRLNARVTETQPGAPLVIMLHGWLGGDRSSYMRSGGKALMDAGFNVARLNMRDHGDTEHLNRDMFNSGRLGEIIDACAQLASRYGRSGTGLWGFSLGANFALRVAAAPCGSAAFPTLAICPVIEPGPSAHAIDNGWYTYRLYFVRRWRQAFTAKERAFPDLYDIRDALELSSVEALTDYFVERFTRYRNSADYFNHYTLANGQLEGLSAPARIIAAADDPVIPFEGLARLPDHALLDVVLTRYGGHCGFAESSRPGSRVDETAVRFFSTHLGRTSADR